MEQEASKGTRDSVYNSPFLHQQNFLMMTVLPNSLLLCHFVRAEHHAEKNKRECGEGRMEAAWLCSSRSIHLHCINSIQILIWIKLWPAQGRHTLRLSHPRELPTWHCSSAIFPDAPSQTSDSLNHNHLLGQKKKAAHQYNSDIITNVKVQ